MADAMLGMFADVGAPLSPLLVASDAMGASDADAGGWGVAAALPEAKALERLFCQGARPGRTVCNSDGDVGRIKQKDSRLRLGAPFSKVPFELLVGQTPWYDVAAGRWAYADHITLGEGRGAIKVLQALACCSGFHRSRVLALMDNMAWSGAATKGRSPSTSLNRLCRMKCGLSLLSEIQMIQPWIDTDLMPADELSRRIPLLGGFLGDAEA